MATITSPRSGTDPVQRITSPSIPSASGTPTSSVRPSLEVPRNNNPLSPALQQNAAPQGPAQRRNRAALRDYYNLKSKAPSAVGGPELRNISRTASITSTTSTSTITSSTAVPDDSAPSALTTQLDDPSFDADDYVTELLKTSSLRDILKTEGSLVSEIKTLDGERKALVYDNYSKLIKAVGTIAEMQKGMHKNGSGEPQRMVSVLGRQKDQQQPPGLDGVKEVGQKLDDLLKIVKDLSPGQREGTKQVVESSVRRRQKETVKWALEAPARLHRLITEGRREDAEHLYTSVVDMVRRWKGVEGVDELLRKCAQVINSGKEEDDDGQEDDTD